MAIYTFFADVVVLLHAAYVGFVIAGLVLVLVGRALGWQWIRNFWFRSVHFLMIGAVVVESLLNIVCPLTTLENHLRTLAGEAAVYPGSFTGRWIHWLLFYDVPNWVINVCYCLFGLAVLAALILIPPRLPWQPYSREPRGNS